MDLGIAGQVAWVLGASQGTGRAIALSLARYGARVGVLARDAEALDALVAEVEAAGGEALATPADLLDAEATEAAYAKLSEAFGAPTLVVHAAASMYRPTKLHNLPLEDAERFLSLDLSSALRCLRLALPGMMLARTGRIVALGSLAARGGVAGGTLYASAKAGLEGMVRGVAVDYGRFGITANVVTLSFVDSERFRTRMGGDDEKRRRLERATATRRIPTVEEVAEVVAFVCSKQAALITGTVVEATGGAHLNLVV